MADYARVLRVFTKETGDFVSAGSLKQLTVPETGNYALGWGVVPAKTPEQGPVLTHEGSNTLWHAVTLVSPLMGLAVVTTANAMSGKSEPVVRDLARTIFLAERDKGNP